MMKNMIGIVNLAFTSAKLRDALLLLIAIIAVNVYFKSVCQEYIQEEWYVY